MEFLCPHCGGALQVPESYLGMRGRCNKCGGRIVLIGRSDGNTPQMATRVEDAVQNDLPASPITEKQIDYLRALGTPENEIQRLNRESASQRIEAEKQRRQEQLPPTERQLACLERLGVDTTARRAIRSRAEASQRIEATHPPATAKQRALLKKLGATPEQLREIKTRKEASALIDAMIAKHGAGERE